MSETRSLDPSTKRGNVEALPAAGRRLLDRTPVSYAESCLAQRQSLVSCQDPLTCTVDRSAIDIQLRKGTVQTVALQEDSKTLEEVEVQKLLEKYPPAREHLLEMLHDLQDRSLQHYLTDDAMAAVASYLGLTLSDVKGTASFYTMFRFAPRGRHVIRICASPPCQLMGATTIQAKLQEKLHVGVGETTGDAGFTLEATSCLGVCGVAPAMMIDAEVYGNLTPARIEAIIDKIRREDEAS